MFNTVEKWGKTKAELYPLDLVTKRWVVKYLLGQIPCCGVAILSVKEGIQPHTDIPGNNDATECVSKSNKSWHLYPKEKKINSIIFSHKIFLKNKIGGGVKMAEE